MGRLSAGLTIFIFAFSSVPRLSAQPADRIAGDIDNRRTVPLPGNRHPLARPVNDLGPVEPETQMQRMIMVLKSDTAQQQALDELLGTQQDARAATYHQWLTPEEFGERFGASAHDMDRLTEWLSAQGFVIDEIPAGGRTIVFSGSAAQVENAFHTSMHRYLVDNKIHVANATDPRIPEPLSGVVAGVVTLHDFPRHTMHSRPAAVPQYSGGGSTYYLAPADFAAIYDVASLYANGINGAGQTIAIVARCNIPVSDAQTFRQDFQLPVKNPVVILNGQDPGITSADELTEADLDSEWPGAVAPQATVDFVVSASTSATDGVDLSAQYIVSHNLAPVMSTSFGSCEADMGAAERSFYNSLWQQAAVQGITTLIAGGDSGAAGCDSGSETTATGGRAVNGLCSTTYSVCVGGTEFNEGSNPGQFWSATNAGNWSSALGYIPETAWNDSGSYNGSGLWAGGGGASAYYSKPAWQSAPGVPADGQRDVPDVSLTASGSHDGYIFVYEGGMYVVGGTSAASPSFAGLMALVNQQTGARQGNANSVLYALATLQGAGGRAYFHDIVTGSNSVPGLTGFQAASGYDQASGLGSVDAAVLVNHWSDAAGIGAPSLTLNVTPASLSVTAGAAGAVVAQVTLTGGFNAPVTFSVTGLPSGVTAAFASPNLSAPGSGSSSITINAPATAAAGVYIVQVAAMGGSVTQTFTVSLTITAPAGCTLAASPASVTVTAGASTSTAVSCGSPASGFSSSLQLTASGLPRGVTATFSPATLTPGATPSQLFVAASSGAQAGSYTLNITASGGGLAISKSLPLTIGPAPTFTLTLAPSGITVLQGASSHTVVTTAQVGSFSSSVAFSVTGQPTGVTASFAPSVLAAPGSGSSALTVQAGPSAAAGIFNFTIKAMGGGITQTLTLPVSIAPPPSFTLSAAQKAVTVGQGATAALNVSISSLVGGFNAPVAFALAQASGASLPAGLNAGFTAAATTAPGTGGTILAFAPNGTATPATYALNIIATGAGVTRTAALSLVVTPPPSFTLHAATASLNALVGGTASTQLTSAAVNGFASTVTLSGGKLPAGVVVTFAPASIPGSNGQSTMTVQTTNAAVPGAYTLQVSAAGGGVASTTPIALNIGRLTVTPQATAFSVRHGSSANFSINTRVTGYYNAAATLSVAGLPKGVTAALSPASVSNSSTGASTLCGAGLQSCGGSPDPPFTSRS